MAHELYPISEKEALKIPHFPTRMQCFIFRNWEIVDPEILAKVLGCTKEQVDKLASDMGLAPVSRVCDDFLKKGYITVIRANWHLCSYEQLMTLVNMSRDELAYTLREDDFLGIKLGHFKPTTPELKYVELTDEQVQRTKEIKKVVQKIHEKIPKEFVKPFDFDPMFEKCTSKHPFDKSSATRFENRIIYSYCSLYGDTFSSKELIDNSFPDKLLRAYEALGINGIWTQAVLYTLSPFPFDPSLSNGYEKRIEGMKYLVSKLKKYGIRLFLYVNEPRAMPREIFKGQEHLMGRVDERTGYASLCMSTPEVQNYLRNAAKFICQNVQGLGGFITITASENHTNCYSHARLGETNCPRCKKKRPSEILAAVNRCLYEGAASGDQNATVIAWNWAWKTRGEENIDENVASLMPKEIGLMSVSEESVEKNVGGVVTKVSDYSISVEGPGDLAKNVWRIGKASSHKTYAKLQLSNSWELSSVPCIGALDKVFGHMKRLAELPESGAVDSLMLGWTLGGFPTPSLFVAREFYGKKIPTMGEICQKMFSCGDPKPIEEAITVLSNAFDEYPFHLTTAYNAPQQVGPSNLLFDEKTGYAASMVCYPYDDLDTWRSIYPREIYIDQMRKVSENWTRGTKMLCEAAKGSSDPLLSAFVTHTLAADRHFRSVYNQAVFVQRRDGGMIDKDIIKDEMDLAFDVLGYMAIDPTIGYESSNHYFYTKYTLFEKIISCEYLLEKYEQK